jgi:hypothetical protein
MTIKINRDCYLARARGYPGSLGHIVYGSNLLLNALQIKNKTLELQA